MLEFFFLVCVSVLIGMIIWIWYVSRPEYEEEQAKKEAKKAKEKQNEINAQAKLCGFSGFNETLKIGENCGIDEGNRLMYYTYRFNNDYTDHYGVISLKRIEHVILMKHYGQRDKSMSMGLKDGLLAGITGGGIIRDSSTLYETYETGGMVLEIEFINNNNHIDRRRFVFNDVIYARKLENKIRSLL